MNQKTHPRYGFMEANPVQASERLLQQGFTTVENYQPLYGLAGDDEALRPCKDRALAIERVIAELGGRPRMIDFGSSLGYFPFYFSDRGLMTTGWDVGAANTAMAKACQLENGLPASFFATALDANSVATIREDEFDVALILSVLHHVVLKAGLPYTQNLIKTLLDKIPVLVLELAHRNEDVDCRWRSALPANPLDVLATSGNVSVQHIGDFGSHLSGGLRPMYVVRRHRSDALSTELMSTSMSTSIESHVQSFGVQPHADLLSPNDTFCPELLATEPYPICNVLFVSPGNSACSVLSEGMLNHWAKLLHQDVRAYSADGLPSAQLNPLALEALSTAGVDITGYRSKSWDEFSTPDAPPLSIVITLCDSAAAAPCPTFLGGKGQPISVLWSCPYPSDSEDAEGGEDGQRRAFEQARQAIGYRTLQLLDVLKLSADRLSRADLQSALERISST